jgi:hypothetical protein
MCIIAHCQKIRLERVMKERCWAAAAQQARCLQSDVAA